MLEELLPQLLQALILVVVSVLGVALRQVAMIAIEYFRQRIGADRTEVVMGFVRTAVRAIEQSPEFRDLDGAGKMEQVLIRTSAFLGERGISASPEFLRLVAEEAVQVMKAELKPVQMLPGEL